MSERERDREGRNTEKERATEMSKHRKEADKARSEGNSENWGARKDAKTQERDCNQNTASKEN